MTRDWSLAELRDRFPHEGLAPEDWRPPWREPRPVLPPPRPYDARADAPGSTLFLLTLLLCLPLALAVVAVGDALAWVRRRVLGRGG